MPKILLKTNLNDSLGGMAERTKNQSIYFEESCSEESCSEESWANPTSEIDNERVNIRPRKSLFYWIFKLGPIQYDKKGKTKFIRTL